MQIIARQFEKMKERVPVGSIVEVPNYIVGSNQLLFYYDGLLCVQGDEFQYNEIGEPGSQSTTIKTNFAFDINGEITFIVLPLYEK